MSEEEVERHDVLIVPANRQMKVADAAAGHLIRLLAASKQAVPTDEAVAKEWAEVYFEPGPSSHEAFTKGTYEGPEPVFREAVIRWGKRPASLDYGANTEKVYFYIEFRGCVFETLAGTFKAKLEDLLYLKPHVFTRPFDSVPPHAEVPEGEEAEDTRLKPSDRGPGLAGTRVEEF
ncbi:MAG: hypothetical protein ACQEXJ_09155 [Myxococcota bacterium]